MANGLTTQQEEFVEQYVGSCRFNATKAAIAAGYSPKTAKSQGSRLLTYVDVQEAISKKREEIRTQGVANPDYRIAMLDQIEQGYLRLIEARKEAYKDVPGAIGGATGLVVGQLKKVTHVRPGEGDEPTETWTEEQWEYVADTAVTKEIRSIYDDVAKEMGQRVDKVDVSGSMKREYVIVRPGESVTTDGDGE